MSPVIIGLIALAVVVVVALALMNPSLRKREDAAIAHVKQTLGADRIRVIEPRATGMGTEPEEAGGLRGMGVLAVTDAELMFATWAGPKDWKIARSTITEVDTDNTDPASAHKLTVNVTYQGGEGEATAMFRLGEPVPWLIELGYDWGPDGPPALDEDDEDDEGDDEDA